VSATTGFSARTGRAVLVLKGCGLLEHSIPHTPPGPRPPRRLYPGRPPRRERPPAGHLGWGRLATEFLPLRWHRGPPRGSAAREPEALGHGLTVVAIFRRYAAHGRA